MTQLRLPQSFSKRSPAVVTIALRDRFVWAALIVALVVNLGLFAFLLLQYGGLPPLVPLHFDSAGQPDRIETKSAIFSLPQIGLLIIVLNFLISVFSYRREPLTAYIMSSAAAVVQVLLWIATIMIIRVVAA